MIIRYGNITDFFSTFSLGPINTISIDLQSSFDIDSILKVNGLIFGRRLA